MADHDSLIDAYIAKAAPFAQPLLEQLRAVVHSACPDIEEDIKWGMPFFSYRGSPLCMMAAFRQHCGFGFWLSTQVVGETAEAGMGQFGKLRTAVDLPPSRQLVDFIHAAMALNDAGAKRARPRSIDKAAPRVPDALAAEFAKKKHAAARATYAVFSAGKQREYVEWIDEAKTDATRRKRIVTALEWLAEGKQRHWKHARSTTLLR